MPPQAVAEALEAPSPAMRLRIAIESEADVILAGEYARRCASNLSFSPSDITVIQAAILEVARNVLRYARRGDLLLHPIQKGGRQGLSIVVHDNGPGIADVSQALKDGKGLGLASVRRLMDEFRVRSEPGRGTTVMMRKWPRRQVERAGRVTVRGVR